MKLFTLFLTLFLTSCSFGTSHLKEYDYDDAIEFKIAANQIFNLAKRGYYVYIYSLTCGHCNLIKQEILTYCLSEKYPTYLVEFQSDMKICSDVSFTYGISNYDDLYILGTPTLLEILDGKLITNIAGSSSILNFINNH